MKSRARWRASIAAPLLAVACEAPPRAQAVAAGVEALPAALLAPYAARVEAARGLRFRRVAPGWRVPDSALRGLLERELDHTATPEELASDAALAAALGLLPPDFELRAALLGFQAANAAGFFSPRTRELYVVDGAASAGGEDVDALFVHELTHALQAQQGRAFDVLLGLRGDDDLAFALTALLEGEATYVELSDAARQRAAPRPSPEAFAARFPGAESAPELPRVVAEPLLAAYPLGYALVDELVARGGARSLGRATADPPLTSEELLHPEKYLDGPREPLAELAREPALPGCRVLATTCYGELVVRAWLAAQGAPAESAAGAAAGWDADRAWRFACDGGGAAAAWLLVYEDAAEARALEDALRELAPTAGGEALALARHGTRLLVSRGLAAPQRERLLALASPRELRSLAAYWAAHSEVRERAREALR
jgi:hypothetical protein